ncbi:BQ5605_C011g06261 [Microbotryum silenes-dioicae]|uniref:BQ5605_C011g06261 protein n=1 Tax=Microbotryum silenes-dioicae TaxID=796604 RepID=A0A2X0LRY8_9BASI|nr:BQ5605_C011g06261 [Microbotryum silenes-dioicae]
MTSPSCRRRRGHRLFALTLIAATASVSTNAAIISPLKALRGSLLRRGPQPFDVAPQPLLVARAGNRTIRLSPHPKAPATPPGGAHNSSSNATVVEHSPNPIAVEGRYGHSAIYVQETNLLYFVGGQLGENGTTVTNEVLVFNLANSIVWNSRPSTRILDNPLAVSSVSEDLDPLAWVASAIDDRGRVWVIGGVTEDCEHDHTVHRLDMSNLTLSDAIEVGAEWTVPQIVSHTPPRRRQAQAVAIYNATARSDDIYVFGGIAEQYTCSDETIGYLGIDRYSTTENHHGQNEVESFAWTAPSGTSAKTFEPPVSDYTATVLKGGRFVAILGGQTAHGGLAPFSEILVFDSRLKTWNKRIARGTPPSPRMGHVAIALPSGAVLVHGGIREDHAVLNDIHLLTPPSDLNSDTTLWTWSTLIRNRHSSLASPSRAWHTATRLVSGTVVFAFGIDTSTGSPSDSISFFTIDESKGEYSFTPQFHGESAVAPRPVTTTSSVRSSTSFSKQNTTSHRATTKSKKKKKKKHHSTSQAAADTTSTIPWATTTHSAQPTQAPATTPAEDTLTTSSSASSVAAVPPVSASTQDDEASSKAAQQTKTIAASVGTLVGLVALVGVAAIFIRRRNSQKTRHEVPDTPLDMTRGGGSQFAPIVSSLMYTRPVQARQFSLGSAMSANNGHVDDYYRGKHDQDGDASTGAVFDAASPDPFSDHQRVGEMGQSHVVGRVGPGGFVEAASASSIETQRKKTSILDAISPSLSASVKSIPFLAGLYRADSNSSYADTYTVRTPSQRSRRPSLQASSVGPSIPPGAAAPEGLPSGTGRPLPSLQEYGVAMLGDSDLPEAAFMKFYPRSASGSRNSSFDSRMGFTGIGANGGGEGGYASHPSVDVVRSDTSRTKLSRASTALRVTNAD